MMNNKKQLCQYYHWLRSYGYNDSHSGNASVRIGNKVLITPTGACADTLQAKDIIKCRLDKVGKRASADAALHLASYKKNINICAVLHSHGAYTVAMTMNGDDFIPQDFEGALYFARVPVLDINYEKNFSQAAKLVPKYLKKHKVVIVRGHGVYAAGRDLNMAYKWTCSLELSAKTAWLAKR
ncbi:MAG: class II aldolase/adducin family protein [Mariprofundales bacterium]